MKAMGSQTFLYLIPYLISLAITCGVGIFAWRRRRVMGALPFALATFGQAQWTLGYILELLSSNLQAKVFWDNFQLFGGVIYVLGTFGFARQYTNHKFSNPKRSWTLLAIIPAIYIVLAFTDGWHGLVHPEALLIPGEPFSELSYDFTIASWITFIYFAGLQLLSIYILIKGFINASNLYRMQVGAIAIGAMIPLIGTTLTIMGVTLSFHRDTTPLTFAIGNLVISWGLFRLRLFDVVPVARDTVVENMRDMLVVLDEQNRVIDLNKAARQALIGDSISKIIGQPAEQIFAPWSNLVERYKRTLETHVEITNGEAENQQFFELDISPVRDRNGNLQGRMILIHEITERVRAERELEQHRQQLKELVVARTAELSLTNQRLRREIVEHERTEQALRESEERYKLATSAGRVGVWEWDLGNNHLHLAPNLIALLGYDEGELELTVENWVEIFHPTEAARLVKTFQELIEGKTSSFELECRLQNKTGELLWVMLRGTLIRDGGGQATSMIGTASDITETRTLAERLENLRVIDKAILAAESPETIAQAALNHLIKMLSCGRVSVIVFDRATQRANILASLSNQDTQPKYSIDLSESFFEPGNDIWRGETRQFEDLAALPQPSILQSSLLKSGTRGCAIVPLKLKDEVIGTLNLGKDQPGFFAPADLEVAREVSDQLAISIQHANLLEQGQQYAEELEQRVQQRTTQLEAANKELEAFAYSVSHDLRAPLRAIDGYSQALLEDYQASLDDMGKAYLQYVRESSHHMSQLINDLLRLSRIMRSEVNREQVDLSAMALKIAEEFHKAQPKRQVKFKIDQGMTVHADPNLLQILIQNLLDNAWKFTSKHPTARIEIGMAEQNQANVYYVRDDGAGFNMSYIDKLFDPFQRLHGAHEFEGSGIGLATVQRIVKRHGGQIWAEGAVEQGATFYFTL